MSENLLQRICQAEVLPSFPIVAVELLRLFKHEDVSLDELAAVVEKDPALAAKLLKTVNSPLFGMPRKTRTLKRAMVALGTRTVKVMVLSFSLADALHSTESGGLDYGDYWRRSMCCAVASRLLAGATAPKLAEEAFAAGLLSDVGVIAAWRSVPDVYGPVLREWSARQRPLAAIESERLGLTHAGIARELLNRWGLPEVLYDAVGAHEGDGLAGLTGETAELARVVYCGAAVAGLFCGDVSAGELARIKQECLKVTAIDAAALERALEALAKHAQEVASMLSLPAAAAPDYGELQAEAAEHLAQLSAEAEVERAGHVRREREGREQIDHLRERENAMRTAASTDPLTGLANRGAFDARLREEFESAQTEGHSLGLILVDLDHFKRVNDAHGHPVGDEVLRHIGGCLRDVARHAGFAARYGGEEFAVIVTGKADSVVRVLAEEIRRTIERRPVRLGDVDLRITASVGGSSIDPRGGGATCEQLIEGADRNLYRAKRGGRNRVVM